MTTPLWQSILSSDPFADDAWPLFHENSKNTRYGQSRSKDAIIEDMKRLHESLPYVGHPIVPLATPSLQIDYPLGYALTSRKSAMSMHPGMLPFELLSTLLHHAYGTTHTTPNAEFVRALRAAPSAGALYPIELFFYSRCVTGLPKGIYHYNPSKNHLRFLRADIEDAVVAKAILQTEIASNASLLLFIAGIFERSVLKYGERGYRYTLLEAGHIAQNVYLVSTALSLACVGMGGYLDLEIDEILGLDGNRQSTIYMMAIGHPELQLEKGALPMAIAPPHTNTSSTSYNTWSAPLTQRSARSKRANSVRPPIHYEHYYSI